MSQNNQIAKAYILVGPGYGDRDVELKTMQSLGFDVQKITVLPAQDLTSHETLTSHDLLLLSGSQFEGPEEKMYSFLLAQKLKPFVQKIIETPVTRRPKVLAIGRGARIAFLSGLAGKDFKNSSMISWLDHSKEFSKPWIEVKSEFSGKTYFAGMSGYSLPDLAQFDNAKPHLKTLSGTSVSWVLDHYLYLSFVDPLALVDGSQLDSYGYESQEDLLSSADYLQEIMSFGNE
jgi:hypothetical protein